ncbi:beta-1,4-N-acetylglucosaminyltransferase [Nematocida displodere]|uniref:UDP-N-acetylglucosamine transferase subunit ALG14 n=1 Tax=Nematocida displodere TaxID=1805483 RepID=A0A177ECJ9_9MICR|nr:beta-1,4-N-acetylglucosaminyltransferase [Nematocida displodere]
MTSSSPESPQTTTVTVVLGGGGHTKEMLEILKVSPVPFERINVVLASCDKHSLRMLQEEWPGMEVFKDVKVFKIPRPNNVLAGYSVVQMGHSLLASIRVAWWTGSEHLLCNGPGLCVPFCAIYRILHPFSSISYVESITRTQTLSLTGRILQYFVDTFIVQSKDLARTVYPKRIFQRVFIIGSGSGQGQRRVL